MKSYRLWYRRGRGILFDLYFLLCINEDKPSGCAGVAGECVNCVILAWRIEVPQEMTISLTLA